MTDTTVARRQVEAVINRVLSESGRAKRELKDEDTLTHTIGLSSLDLAQIVVSLEQELGVDPFRVGTPRVSTFGDLAALYRDAVGQSE